MMGRRQRVNWIWLVSAVATIAIFLFSSGGQRPVSGATMPRAIAASTLFPQGVMGIDHDRPRSPAIAHNKSTSMAGYAPQTEVAWADPTNFGDRFATDVHGRAVTNDFIIVLHETVGSANSAINTFRTPHPRDDDQVSYHTLIRVDGTVVYVVPPEKRAFGAGNSVFVGANGAETVVTNPSLPGSVNNFAYHISLESPADGRGNGRYHSGYTDNQYRSLAWLIAQSTVPNDRITTHQAVDRSGSRLDPRSFNGQTLWAYLTQYSRGV